MTKSNIDEEEKVLLFNEVNNLREIVSFYDYFAAQMMFLSKGKLNQVYNQKFWFDKYKLTIILGSSEHCEDVRFFWGWKEILYGHWVSEANICIVMPCVKLGSAKGVNFLKKL